MDSPFELTLVIAEKPSVARDIAKVLKVSGKGDGCLVSERYIVSWAIGHLVTLCEPEDYDPALKRWKAADLPIIPVQIKLKAAAKTGAQLRVLKKWMTDKRVTSIICATDAGREGELIFRYIYDFAGCRKPVSRLWISSMTDAAIRDGLANLRPAAEFDNLYYSARCRSHADWLVGINASRAYSIQYSAHLSIGRVQTPTLAMIVVRQAEIDNFVSKDYWEVDAQFAAANGEYAGKWFDENAKDGRIDDVERAKAIVAAVKGQQGVVDSVETEEKRRLPPLLHDLPELQRECNRRFGYSAAKTLGIAQDLYEKRKLITYPRTDSRHLSGDMIPKLGAVIAAVGSASAYTPFAKYIQGLSKLPITKRLVDDAKVTDHHAIIPTEKRPTTALSAEERNVYDAIVRRFLAAFYPAHVQDVTTVITLVVNHTFKSRGATLRQIGWRELYLGDKDEDDLQALPALVQGEHVRVLKAASKAKKTQPPKLYTEATLLSAMENAGKLVEDEEIAQQMKDSGLGTAATRAAIIERLLTVGYIRRSGKSLVPTDKGKSLIQILPSEITSAETTGRWEKGLAAVSRGGLDADRFMGSIGRFVSFLVGNAQSAPPAAVAFENDKPRYSRGKGGTKAGSKANSKVNPNAIGKCPLCKGDVLENAKGYYCAKWRSGCKFNIWKRGTASNQRALSAKEVAVLLAGEAVAGQTLADVMSVPENRS